MMPYQFSTTWLKRSHSRWRSACSPCNSAICSEFSRARTRLKRKSASKRCCLKSKPDQRRADPLGQRRPEHRIDQRAPDQIAGNRDIPCRTDAVAPPSDRPHRMMTKEDSVTIEFSRSSPISSVRSTNSLTSSVDALVRIVGGVALQLHAIMIGAVQPFAEIVPGQPAPPADLQPLIEIELVDRKHDEAGGQHAKYADLADEDVPVLAPAARCRSGCSTGSAGRRSRPARVRSRSPRQAARGRPICPRNGNRGRRCATRWRASSGCCSQITVSGDGPQRPEEIGRIRGIVD